MSKIKLDMDALRVESFATVGSSKGSGTVVGHASGIYGTLCYEEEDRPTDTRPYTMPQDCTNCSYGIGGNDSCKETMATYQPICDTGDCVASSRCG